jgi:hypothetical protein
MRGANAINADMTIDIALRIVNINLSMEIVS